MWIYQTGDLLYFGYCLFLDIVCGSTRVDLLYLKYCLYLDIVCTSTSDWLCCNLDTVHILEWTAYLCKLSEYLYTDILC